MSTAFSKEVSKTDIFTIFTHIECMLGVVIVNPMMIQGFTLEKLSPHPLGCHEGDDKRPLSFGLTLRLGRGAKKSSFLVGVSEMLTSSRERRVYVSAAMTAYTPILLGRKLVSRTSGKECGTGTELGECV